jgi:hypothetical protein
VHASDNVYAFKRSPPPSAAAAPDARRADAKAQRRKLWELPATCHCPIVGSCLHVDRLRQLLDDLFAATSRLGDFELHAGVVRECATRNKVAEAVQIELDGQHDAALRLVEPAESDEELAQSWRAAAGSGDVAGVFWAILTHAHCGDELRNQLLCDMHMFQHHASAALRDDMRLARALALENQRLHQELAEKVRQCEQLRSAMVSPLVARAGWPSASRLSMLARLVLGTAR